MHKEPRACIPSHNTILVRSSDDPSPGPKLSPAPGHTFPFIVFCPQTVWFPIILLGYAIVRLFVWLLPHHHVFRAHCVCYIPHGCFPAPSLRQVGRARSTGVVRTRHRATDLPSSQKTHGLQSTCMVKLFLPYHPTRDS